MTATRRNWVWFTVGVGVVVAVLAGVTALSLGLERRDQIARARAAVNDSIRLALWQMDSTLTPVIAREASRPYQHYMENVTIPPPMASNSLSPTASPADRPSWVRLYFQWESGKGFTTPERVDLGLFGAGVEDDGAAHADAGLSAFGVAVDGAALAKALQEMERQAGGSLVVNRVPERPAQSYAMQQPRAKGQRPGQGEAQREYQQRAQVANLAQQSNAQQQFAQPAPSPSLVVQQGPLLALWRGAGAGRQLVFARRVTVGTAEYVQGFWADWTALERVLLASCNFGPQVASVTLSPVGPDAHDVYPWMLASIPVRLDVTEAPVPWRLVTPVTAALLVGWLAVGGAMVGVGYVLRAAVELGERRGQFVSAVTHELRTPLTTFRMYSEMLAEGMVPDEAARHEYLTTLTREAERLSDVVERILLYARVERNRAAPTRERVTVQELVDRILPRLVRRAGDAGFEVVAELNDAAATGIDTDVQAVEQILFNLVDNSCKYAGEATDRRLCLKAHRAGRSVAIAYADHGPGIPAADAGLVFEPFRRGGRHTNGSTPGIGLGLALSRGLARELGGELELRRSENAGAVFVVTLPAG